MSELRKKYNEIMEDKNLYEHEEALCELLEEKYPEYAKKAEETQKSEEGEEYMALSLSFIVDQFESANDDKIIEEIENFSTQ